MNFELKKQMTLKYQFKKTEDREQRKKKNLLPK